MGTIFDEFEPVAYEGPDSENPLAFRYYEADKEVFGKTMADHLRCAVCYWHSFCWTGTDAFGLGTFARPWFEGNDEMAMAKSKLNAAFTFFEKLGQPFFCFHDRDVAPEGETLRASNANLDHMVEAIEAKMEETGVKLLWGTANLFGHPRYMAGASTNPDPEVFAYAAGQVRHCLEVTHRLEGANYVLWGGREGYETLLNTDMKRELDQLGRFMSMVVEHKHKIGFKGTLLIEPKPHEPTKHQYDYDVAAVYAFLQKYDLLEEMRVNIEANHATLAGHSFQHELEYALASEIFGSVDINRGDPLLGWDTDQFPTDLYDVTLALYLLLQAGGFESGGFNFDAKLRRQSIDPVDLLHAHIGGMDTLARGLMAATKMIEDDLFKQFLSERYAAWDIGMGQSILDGAESLETLGNRVEENNLDPHPRSGRQEMLENLLNRYI